MLFQINTSGKIKATFRTSTYRLEWIALLGLSLGLHYLFAIIHGLITVIPMGIIVIANDIITIAIVDFFRGTERIQLVIMFLHMLVQLIRSGKLLRTALTE